MRPWLLLAMAALAACDSEPPAPIVVYAPAELEAQLDERLADSNFAITFVTGGSREITDRIIAKQDSPRADILITNSAIDIWRAAGEGALRPLEEASLAGVPDVLKDPDGFWAALGYRRVFLGAVPGTELNSISSLGDLGAPGMAGNLCLTSFRLPENRALVGLLVEELGVKPAERLVRNWVRNLAVAPFADEADLLTALEQGDCQVGIISGDTQSRAIDLIEPQPGYLLIEGIGVSRHAENADAAQRFVNQLLSEYQADDLDDSAASNAGIAGWHSEEARLLAERAGYR